jgi:hypothetical protein
MVRNAQAFFGTLTKKKKKLGSIYMKHLQGINKKNVCHVFRRRLSLFADFILAKQSVLIKYPSLEE